MYFIGIDLLIYCHFIYSASVNHVINCFPQNHKEQLHGQIFWLGLLRSFGTTSFNDERSLCRFVLVKYSRVFLTRFSSLASQFNTVSLDFNYFAGHSQFRQLLTAGVPY